ncbi:MAG: 2-oxoacid:acceptor oxidoreductase subunit alpha [Bdellovibrionaceae bacterium]|nr:2-oxoacid:acceptor oxidoreductase subunit alpha [Pseudobdellovibrionaceae bacterium]
MAVLENISIIIGTVNGSGSQSANLILQRAIFRMGVPVVGKNLFPSNIAGLPTWFVIRANKKGYSSLEKGNDIVIAMNPQTANDDVQHLKPNSTYICNSNIKLTAPIPTGCTLVAIDFTKLAGEVVESIKVKKLLTNMVYVGVVAEMLGIPKDILDQTIRDQFAGKEKVVDINIKAADAGRAHASTLSELKTHVKLQATQDMHGKILVDGNTAAGLGSVYAGCTFTSWYPITPSSSLAESYEAYAHRLLKDSDSKNNFVMIQAEDELGAICMVAGAGWSGARAMTATSGPGISLMAEAAGLMYFAEIPGVIWNVQRAGPSTGLPTRTQQGDVLSCALLSHGDTRHPILFPANPKECFDFATTAFNLAEEMQTLVFVLSDLDLGMNQWICDEFEIPAEPIRRGKVLDVDGLVQAGHFKRYADVDGDGVPYRTLPGTEHPLAGFFTRGTGHDNAAKYSEDPVVFEKLLDRLTKKWDTLKTKVPLAEIHKTDSSIGIITYGSTLSIIKELQDQLAEQKTTASTMRLKAFPFGAEVPAFIAGHDKIFVLEQNRDGQMKKLLSMEFPELAHKLKSVVKYDGWPVRADHFAQGVLSGNN